MADKQDNNKAEINKLKTKVFELEEAGDALLKELNAAKRVILRMAVKMFGDNDGL